MSGACFELKVVSGKTMLTQAISKVEIEIYAEGRTATRSRDVRGLHTWAIEHGFIFRRDQRMLFGGYYRHPKRDLYAAILYR